MKVLPISENKKFKYSIYFQSFDEESLEMGSSVDSGYEKIESVDTIGDILRLANSTYGIYYPVSFGVWESTEPLQNTEYFEKGIRKYFSLHIHNEDGTEISSDENDFITFLLSDGQYNSDVFEEYAIGGVVLGALLGVGALITYFYFKNKKVSDSYTSTNPRAKSVVRNINGKDRKFPIKDAWRNEHNIENKRENYEVPQGQRLNKFELGGDASEHYHEIEYGQGGVAKAKDIIMNKIGWNENIADYLVSKSEKFAIWLADSILKREIEIRREPKSNVLYALNERAISINTNFLNNYYSTEIREILDWLQHPLTPKQELKQLSFEQALEKAREWHEELEVLGGDVDFIEPDTNIILKNYPKNKEGIEYYWSLIPSNFCDLESSRMGHCGRTGYNNQLISLRSIRPYGKGHTINDSHVTIAYGVADGLFKQIKGKKNNKPAEKYFPYIFDLIKSISDGQINKKLEEISSEKQNELKDAIGKIDSLAKELSQEVLFSIYSPSSTQLAFLKGERENFLESKSLSMNPLSYVNNDGFIADNVRLLVRLKNKQLEVRNNRDWEAIESEMDRLLKENLDYYRKNIVEKYKEYDKLNKLVNAQRQTIPTLMFNGFGSEYANENDYGFEDMSDDELRQLFEINPSTFSSAKSLLFLFDKNIISKEEYIEIASKYDDFDTYVIRLELFNRGIVSEKPSTIFKLNYSCGEVDRLLNSSGNTSLVEGLLCGDFDDEYYDNFSYYFDNPSDLVDNLDKENSKRIIDEIVIITNYDESEVIENGINYYLNGEDENFTKDDFYGICRSLANAQNYADRDDYFVYAQKELRSAIEELGKVEYLDDRGLSIEIDLLDFKTEKEIAEKMDYWEFESISDLFEEFVSADSIDLPRFEIDDRYSPYGDTKVFNDYLSDSDLETYNKGGKLKTKNTIKNNKIKTMNSLDSEFKGGGNVGAISKTKIVITENKEENKIQATRTLVKENSEGEKITYELLVGKHTDKESKPNRYADGWFEIYATDEDDNEYFYAEGGLWLQGNKVVDYDGVYELSEKLRPLMSALNMNSSEVFSEGGAVGLQNTAKYYWNTFDKTQKKDFLIGAGYSESVANDLASEDWESLESGVHNDLTATIMKNGGAVKSKSKKKRQPKVTRIQFEEGNYEYAGGGGANRLPSYFFKGGKYALLIKNSVDDQKFQYYEKYQDAVEDFNKLKIGHNVTLLKFDNEGRGESITLKISDLARKKIFTDGTKYAKGGGVDGVIVYDNDGETFDRYTIFTPDGSVYGMSDNALMPNGFNQYLGDNTEVEKGSHLGKKLKSIPESIKVAVERRMSEYEGGGSVKSKRRKKRQPKVTRIQFEEGNYEYEGGGGVDKPINQKKYRDYRYTKGYSRGWEYINNVKPSKKYIIDLIIDDGKRQLYFETNDSTEILKYVEKLKKEAKNLQPSFESIEVRDAIDGDMRRILVVDSNNGKWSEIDIYRTMNSLLLQDTLITYGFEPQHANIDDYAVDFYDDIEEFDFYHKKGWRGYVMDDTAVVYSSEYEDSIETENPQILEDFLSNLFTKKYEGGGKAGKKYSRSVEDGATYIVTQYDESNVATYRFDSLREAENQYDRLIDYVKEDIANDESNYTKVIALEGYVEGHGMGWETIRAFDVDEYLESFDDDDDDYAGGGGVEEVGEAGNKKQNKEEKRFSVWVGGEEVNDYYLSEKEAKDLAFEYEDDGYDDVVIADKDEYAEGGKVEDWMEEALISLKEETGNGDLEITYVSNDGTEFYAIDGDVEYRVFKTEDDAERVAVEQVREDMEETPENFNQDFIAGYVDGRDFFTEALNEMNYSYANDIQTESDDKYENRLIAEMVENGLMDEEDAESGNADELADYYKDDYVSLLTEGQLNEGANGLQHFIDNFGEEEAMRMVIENNLIDIERASTDAVRVDGIAHFLSSYDGETLYLSNNYVAYRIN